MPDNCFEETYTENLNYCPNTDLVAGVSVDFYYTPVAFVETFVKPVVTAASTYAERITLPANSITFKAGKGWKKATMLVEEGELKPTIVGNKGNKKSKTDFDSYIPNFIAANIGFVDTHRNTPMIWAIPDSTGKKWVVGNPDTPAFFDKADSTTGKKLEDNSGTAITVTANTKPYVYAGEIVELPDTPETP